MTSIDRLSAALADRYAIERELGQGGMATVYLARDVKHDRHVALKVLRPELAAVIGAERFLAEIKTTAGLQHPHILPLHDSGEADGTVFYVMPFIEGETLRDRLRHEKQLPVDDAVRITREVAGALDYAHRHGVVHRDIKPENILLHDGQALVADFGIALAVSRSEGGTRMTETGMSLGTPHYMAPEQAMGEREITAKADVYALGCVLYEMLTGDPPFTGSTAQAIVARTLTENPRAITIQRHTVPAHVEAAVFTAIEKLPADRFASAGEFAAALENPALTRRTVTAGVGGAVSGGGWKVRAAVPAMAVATVAVIALAWTSLRPKATAQVSRFALGFVASQAPSPERGFSVSRDGRYFAYVGPAEGGGLQVWVKPRDREQATPVPGTNGVVSVVFSPDGEWLSYTLPTQRLMKVPVIGGAAIQLADTASPNRGHAWLDDGTIVFVRNGGTALKRVSVTGGAPATTIWTTDTSQMWFPTPLPDARGVLVANCIGGSGAECAQRDLWAISADGKTQRTLLPGVMRGTYVPTGHIVVIRRDGALLAVPFSLRSLEVKGAPVPVLDSVSLGVNFAPMFTVTDDGTLYVRAGGSNIVSPEYELAWVDREGRESAIDSAFRFRVTAYAGNVGWSLSPDGNRLAIGLNTDAGDNIWVRQLPRGPTSRISFDSAPSFRPRWTRDGKFVMYVGRRPQRFHVVKRAADGTGSEIKLYDNTTLNTPEAAPTLDDSTMLVRLGGTVSLPGGRDIGWARIGDSTFHPLVATREFDESAMALSPDGKWLAYESNETGKTEVYIKPYPNADAGKWQVSTDGGRAPLWSRNGRELFYVNGARAMVVVPIGAGAAPQLGARTPLFRLREEWYLTEQENYTPFDIAPDGSKFIMARRVRAGERQIAPLVVVENWFTEMLARANRR